jgi:hypothetical protein
MSAEVKENTLLIKCEKVLVFSNLALYDSYDVTRPYKAAISVLPHRRGG